MDYETLERRRFDSVKRTNDPRTEWDRDYARLIHSSTFRRLQSKTQVLGLGESDFYRTRLTHSLEVSQIGTGLLRVLKETYANNTEISSALPDEHLMSAICLAHDIGHPPFGHGGEVALNYCMREYGGFEGNGQTLRIISKLDKCTEEHGLNPTRRMLLGVLKYPVPYSELVNSAFYAQETEREKNLPHWLFNATYQKPPKCFHDEEKDVVNFIFEAFDKEDIAKFTVIKEPSEVKEPGKPKKIEHLKAAYKSLDTSIMDMADNISYSLHDLEDAISLGMITNEKWLKHFETEQMKNLFINCHNGHFDETAESLAKNLFGQSHLRKDAIGSMVHILITNTEIVENGSGCKEPLLKYKAQIKSDFEKLRDKIFELVKTEVIFNENVKQLEFKGQKLIVELFSVLASDPNRFLPKATKERWAKSPDNLKMRVICDYVSGMTDDYATRLYEKIIQPRLGSIFDRL